MWRQLAWLCSSRKYLAARLAESIPRSPSSRLKDEDFRGIQQVSGILQGSKDVDAARRAFNELNRSDPRLWNAVIAAIAIHGSRDAAFFVFRQMISEGIAPNRNTYLTILKGCNVLDRGKLLEALCRESGMLLADVSVGSSVVDMYRSCRSVADAQRVFDALPVKTVVAWTSMIQALSELGCFQDAIVLFQQAQVQGVEMDRPFFLRVLAACSEAVDISNGALVHRILQECGLETGLQLGNSLAHMYAVCGDLESVKQVFEQMEERNAVSWNTFMKAYLEQGDDRQVLRLYQQMQLEGTKPEAVTFVATLEACAAMADVVSGKLLHCNINETDLGLQVQDSLVNMYGKCGHLQDATLVFEGLQKRDLLSWNTIISSYAMHGYRNEAAHLFQRMQLEGFAPNRVTFLSLLNCCSNPDALKDGQDTHRRITGAGYEGDYLIQTSIVNMYSRMLSRVPPLYPHR